MKLAEAFSPIMMVFMLCAFGGTPLDAAAQDKSKDENDSAIIVRSITIDNSNIFDSKDPRESGVFYRTTNSLHITTRKKVIRDQLLFKEGDEFSISRLHESERILRANRYIADANIQYTLEGNFADIVVSTKDTWSTKPKLNYSKSGGATKSEIGIKEENILGTGVNGDISFKSDADRTSYVVGVANNHLFHSWYSLGIDYESSSDGYKKSIALIKPFYAFDTRSSHGASFLDNQRNEAYYQLGEKYFEYQVQQKTYELQYGWSSGLINDSVFRHTLGMRYDQQLYAPTQQYFDLEQRHFERAQVNQFVASHALVPNDQKDVYPFYRVEFLQDRYQKVTNIDHIGKVEDRYMGFKSGLELGYSSTEFGSYEDTLLLNAYLSKTFNLNPSASLSLNSDVNLRWPEAKAPTLISTFLVKYYQEQSEHFKFYSDMYIVKGHNLGLQDQLFLGNETGLRGFPAHYLSGDQVQKLTLEERYYSKAKPFRIFGLGAALFMDVGRISGGNELERQNNGTYSNVGVGLRLANNRSSQGDIIHLDFAVPIGNNAPDKGFQINLQLKQTF